MRPRPRVPGKPNPAMKGFQSQMPAQEANARQIVPQQLSHMQARANAAQSMAGKGKKQMYKRG
jgi:hypothetical protein